MVLTILFAQQVVLVTFVSVQIGVSVDKRKRDCLIDLVRQAGFSMVHCL